MVVWQFPTEKTRVFRALLIVCIGESAFNILSSIGLANAGVVPQIVNEILAFVFFSFEGLSSLMIYKYMVVISELDQRQKKRAVSAAMIPAAFFFIFLLLTPFIGFYYYFQDGVYHQGRGANFGYFYIMLFFALNPIYAICAGAAAGKDGRKLWALPVITALLFLIGTWLFFDWGEKAFFLYALIYLFLGIAAMLISMFIKKKRK